MCKIPCTFRLQFIGETKESSGDPSLEHQAAVRWGELEKKAVAEHAWTEYTVQPGMRHLS